MAGPYTPNAGLVVATTGSLVDTWADQCTNPDFSATDGFVSGIQTIPVASSPVTLTVPAGFAATPGGGPTQAQNLVLKLSGTVTAPVTITLPMPGSYIMDTTGLSVSSSAFVSLRAVGVGEVIGLPFAHVQRIYNDGTNVRFVNLQPVATFLDYALTAVPGWITICTKPPFLLCDGSSFSNVTYPLLAQLLGSTTLPDYRGRKNHFLNGGTARLTAAGAGIDGNTLFATGGDNGINLAANQIPTISSAGAALTIPVGGAGHVATYLTPQTAPGVTNGSVAYVFDASGSANIQFVTTFTSPALNVTYTNGSQVVVPDLSPGIVGGIRLIRAG